MIQSLWGLWTRNEGENIEESCNSGDLMRRVLIIGSVHGRDGIWLREMAREVWKMTHYGFVVDQLMGPV